MSVMGLYCVPTGTSKWEQWLLFCEGKAPLIYACEVEVWRQFERHVRAYLRGRGLDLISTHENSVGIWDVRNDVVIRTFDLVASIDLPAGGLPTAG